MEQGGETVDNGKSTPERVAGRVAQALSQEGCQEWYPEHSPQEALVRIEKRVAPDSKEKGHPSDQEKGTPRARVNSVERRFRSYFQAAS